MRLSRPWIVFACILVGLGTVCLWTIMHVGDWLVVEDPVETAYAIVVLSGSMPDRAMEAAHLYQQDAASRVWISQPLSPTAELEQMHISFLGEDFYNQKVLMALGVPADAIHILEKPSANTEEEVDEIARDCRSDGAHKVIIVTSKAHTRRVRLIWRRRIGEDPRLIIRYAEADAFDAAHWWRGTQDALNVVRELLGIANAWAGFPLRPVPH